MEVKYPNVTVELSESDGNAFVVLGKCAKAARRAGLTPYEVAEFTTEARMGDYDHLLQTCFKYFNVE